MDLYLFQLVDKPTRHDNVLDLVLTNLPSLVTFIDTGLVFVEAGLPSDHFPVVFEVNASLKLKDSPKRLCYDLKNADFTSLNNVLSLLPLSAGVESINSQAMLDNAWRLWCSLVLTAVDSHISIFLSKGKNRPPWINKDLANEIKKKKTLWKRVRNSTSKSLKEKFRKMRQSIKNWIRRERRAYLIDIANQAPTNPKRFWSFYSFKNKKKPIPDKINYKGVSLTDDSIRAEAFNDYFKSIYKDHSNCLFPFTDPAISGDPSKLELIQTSNEEVLLILSSLDTSKATGPDNLSAAILKIGTRRVHVSAKKT